MQTKMEGETLCCGGSNIKAAFFTTHICFQTWSLAVFEQIVSRMRDGKATKGTVTKTRRSTEVRWDARQQVRASLEL